MARSRKTATRIPLLILTIVLAPMPTLGADYKLELSPDFRSNLQVPDIVNVAVTEMTRAIQDVRERDDGTVELHPSTPRVERVVGCRGGTSCAAMFDPSASLPAMDVSIWLVVIRGDYHFPHVGVLENQLGYIAIDAVSGSPIGSGTLPDPDVPMNK